MRRGCPLPRCAAHAVIDMNLSTADLTEIVAAYSYVMSAAYAAMDAGGKFAWDQVRGWVVGSAARPPHLHYCCPRSAAVPQQRPLRPRERRLPPALGQAGDLRDRPPLALQRVVARTVACPPLRLLARLLHRHGPVAPHRGCAGRRQLPARAWGLLPGKRVPSSTLLAPLRRFAAPTHTWALGGPAAAFRSTTTRLFSSMRTTASRWASVQRRRRAAASSCASGRGRASRWTAILGRRRSR